MHSFWQHILEQGVAKPWQDKAIQLELPWKAPTVQVPWSRDTNQAPKEDVK